MKIYFLAIKDFRQICRLICRNNLACYSSGSGLVGAGSSSAPVRLATFST